LNARVRSLASALTVRDGEEEVLYFLLAQGVLASLAVAMAGSEAAAHLSSKRAEVAMNRDLMSMLVVGRYRGRERRNRRAVLRYKADDGERDEKGSRETAFEARGGGSGVAARYRER